jgi:hypothetical protein
MPAALSLLEAESSHGPRSKRRGSPWSILVRLRDYSGRRLATPLRPLLTQSRRFARHAHFSNARCKGATPDHVVKLDLHVEGAPR